MFFNPQISFTTSLKCRTRAAESVSKTVSVSFLLIEFEDLRLFLEKKMKKRKFQFSLLPQVLNETGRLVPH